MIDLSARWIAAAFALAAALITGPLAVPDASAQRIQRYEPERPAGIAGRFDYYVLSLSWSPTHCAEAGRDGNEAQCQPRDGRRFAFVLHGLWPQYERGFPEFCPTRDRPFVPEAVIGRMQDIMPGRALTIHQYRKHGTCSGLEPAPYFELARKIFQRVKIPARFIDPERDQVIDTASVVREFVAANPGLGGDAIAVTCGGTGNRLREVRVCFTRDGAFRPCGSGEDTGRLCRSPRVFVPPVRIGQRRLAPGAPSRPGEEILPGPVRPGPPNPPAVRNL